MSKKKKKKSSGFTKWMVGIALVASALGCNKLKSYVDWEALEHDITQVIPSSESQPTPEGLEIPSMSTDKQGQIIRHIGHTLAYNEKTRTPQWVAWELTKAETEGKEKREDFFQPDPDVRGSKVQHGDYIGSGYDRGHMAPAADMKWNKQAMEEAFYMSNICPQDHSLNAGVWNTLENQCRTWARRYGKVYIVCGPIYNGKRRTEYIGKRRVKVPDAFFKVVLIYEARKTLAMGFFFENESGQQPLTHYMTTVDSIEQATGIDFFPTLPDDIENKLEAEQHSELP